MIFARIQQKGQLPTDNDDWHSEPEDEYGQWCTQVNISISWCLVDCAAWQTRAVNNALFWHIQHFTGITRLSSVLCRGLCIRAPSIQCVYVNNPEHVRRFFLSRSILDVLFGTDEGHSICSSSSFANGHVIASRRVERKHAPHLPHYAEAFVHGVQYATD